MTGTVDTNESNGMRWPNLSKLWEGQTLQDHAARQAADPDAGW